MAQGAPGSSGLTCWDRLRHRTSQRRYHVPVSDWISMSSSSRLMVLMWVTCRRDSLGPHLVPQYPQGSAFPRGGNCTPAPGGHPTLAWAAADPRAQPWGVLTEKTLSGWPLALMLVSWTCFSTIQASSCFPFCEGRDRSPWDTPDVGPGHPISSPCLGPATHSGIPPSSSSPPQGPPILHASLAGSHHPPGGSCPVPRLSNTYLGLPAQASPLPWLVWVAPSPFPTRGCLPGDRHATLHSRSLMPSRFPPGHGRAPPDPTSR